MFQKICTIFMVIVAVTFVTGCSTLAGARSSKGTGLSREYSASINVVWKTLPTVLAELSLPLVEENKKEGYILAQRGATGFSWGENVAIFVETMNELTRTTRVEIVSKRVLATNVFAPDWSQEILDKLSVRLTNISKSRQQNLIQANLAATTTVIFPTKLDASGKVIKDRLVLMPMRVAEEDKNLQGAMEAALIQGLQQGYVVFSGEQVSQKSREIFLKESRAANKQVCDEARCMQNIAEAFQAELIATVSVTKRSGGYFLALSIQNIFDNKIVFSNSMPCESCNEFQVVEQLKELSGRSAQ